jgi:hypothetical protein
MRYLIALALIAVSALGQAHPPRPKESAPDSVASLPAQIRHDLDLRHCLIPKYEGSVDAKDLAYTLGHFHSRLLVDYAVECHVPVSKVANVIVYSDTSGAWSGEVIASAPFDTSHNSDYCEDAVGVATPAEIRDYARAFVPEELKELPQLDHDGVEIGICEKASVMHYFSNGKWLGLQGAD